MESFFYTIYTSFRSVIKFPTSEKFYLLNYIKAISNSGQDEKLSIVNKIIEYRKRKKFFLMFILQEVMELIESGKTFADALLGPKVITEREYHILKNSKGGLANGIDKIIETSQKSNKSTLAFMYLVGPPALILLLLYFSHGAVKNVLWNMLEPIRATGATPPEIKAYLLDPTVYLLGNIAFFTLLFSVMALMYFLKHKAPKKFLGIIPIIEEEYTLDVLKSIRTVMSGGGINISNAAKALANGEPNNIKKMIFEEIVKRTSNGKKELSQILEDFNVNYNTVSSIKIGEDSNNIDIGLKIAVDELELRYERDINIFLKVGLWGGQFGMILIAGKPMIDMLLLMSVGQLDFQV